MEENRKCRYGDIGMRMQGRSQNEIAFIQALLEQDPQIRPNAEEALNMAIFDEDKSAILNAIRLNKFLASESNFSYE